MIMKIQTNKNTVPAFILIFTSIWISWGGYESDSHMIVSSILLVGGLILSGMPVNKDNE